MNSAFIRSEAECWDLMGEPGRGLVLACLWSPSHMGELAPCVVWSDLSPRPPPQPRLLLCPVANAGAVGHRGAFVSGGLPVLCTCRTPTLLAWAHGPWAPGSLGGDTAAQGATWGSPETSQPPELLPLLGLQGKGRYPHPWHELHPRPVLR